MDIDIIKFAVGVAGITLAAFIVWLLLREIRLWYWKTDNLIKLLKHINKRIQMLDHRVEDLSEEISSINRNMTRLSELFDDTLITIRRNDPLPNEEETEEIIAKKIKD